MLISLVTVSLDNGMTELEIYYDASLKLVGVAINTSDQSGTYMFSVFKGFWTHLGISWKSEDKSIGIQK